MKERIDKLANANSKINTTLEDRMYLVEKGKAAQADLRDARNTLSKVRKENRALEQVNKRAEFERAKLAEFRQREQSLKDKVATLNIDIHQARKALAVSFPPKTGPLFLETEGGCDGSETSFRRGHT